LRFVFVFVTILTLFAPLSISQSIFMSKFGTNRVTGRHAIAYQPKMVNCRTSHRAQASGRCAVRQLEREYKRSPLLEQSF